MAKFHINGNGEAGACKAEKGGCPFGGESDHFTSADAARSAYEDQMTGQAAGKLQKPLPNLNGVYSEAPPGNIGFAKAVSDLKGLQRDIDADLVKPADVPSRIALIADNVEVAARSFDPLDKYSNGTDRRLDYAKKLRKLSRGATAAKTLTDQPHWKEALTALIKADYSKTSTPERARAFQILEDRLNGNGMNYDGYSDREVLERAKAIRDSLMYVRNPQQRLIAEKLDAALKADGRLS